MNANEIKTLIANITRANWELNEALEENGGELTEELLAKLEIIEDLKALLAGEGVDDLGRWLKSLQDELAARKAEADAAARKVKAMKGREDYVKFLINEALKAIGQEKVKGTYYTFERTTSLKSSVNQEALEAKYLDALRKAAEKAKIPAWIDVALKTTTTAIREADALEFLDESKTPALKFTKPRANAKKEE